MKLLLLSIAFLIGITSQVSAQANPKPVRGSAEYETSMIQWIVAETFDARVPAAVSDIIETHGKSNNAPDAFIKKMIYAIKPVFSERISADEKRLYLNYLDGKSYMKKVIPQTLFDSLQKQL